MYDIIRNTYIIHTSLNKCQDTPKSSVFTGFPRSRDPETRVQVSWISGRLCPLSKSWGSWVGGAEAQLSLFLEPHMVLFAP